MRRGQERNPSRDPGLNPSQDRVLDLGLDQVDLGLDQEDLGLDREYLDLDRVVLDLDRVVACQAARLAQLPIFWGSALRGKSVGP
jgi:hypothetical protein